MKLMSRQIIMRHGFVILTLIFIRRLHAANLTEKPPSIYEWIEENAHICTSIPSEGQNVINFLTPEEGRKCSLCPETPPNKIPTSACAVELPPNEVDVEIGCHPVPELCILELRTRFEDFFGATKTAGTNPTQNSNPQEEEIFMAKSNPFDGNLIASLGRSSNNNPTRSQLIPQSTIFVASTQQSTTTQMPTTIEITTSLPSTTTGAFTTTRLFERPTTVSSPLRHEPSQTQPTAHHQFTAPTITIQESAEDEDLIQVDADSGNLKVSSTTVRANVFSSASGGAPIHIGGRLNEIANQIRASVPLTTTRLSINKEIMPNEMPKLDPSKALFEKRTDPLASSQSTLANRQFNNNSWALLHSASPQLTVTTPLSVSSQTTKRSVEFNQSSKLLSNDKEKVCKDDSILCCFWSIAGECDTNPFWMRVHCSKTCGTCGCLLKEADQCVSTGINCTIPTTTTTTTPLPTTRLTTTPSTTTEPSTTTTRLTPPPKFNRFTVKARNLPRWKAKPLDTNPAGPPAFRPKNDEDGSSISNQVQTSVPIIATTTSVFISGEYAESAVKVSSSSRETVRRPGIQGPVTPSSEENSVESTELPSTLSPSTQSTTTTPGNCFNYNRLCQFWADLGECIRNPFWMRPHCQLACKSCGETLHDVFAPKSKPNCANQAVLCPFWSFIGECARNPRWMLKNCAASCQVC